MATKQRQTRPAQPANGNGADVPAGFTQIDTLPKQVEMELGVELVGTLGPVVRSKNPAMPDFRTIRTADGLFYVPSHAALQCLLEYPVGTRAFMRLDGGEGTKNSPYEWSVGIADAANADIPF